MLSWSILLVGTALAADPRIQLVELSGEWEAATRAQAEAGQWSVAQLPDSKGVRATPETLWLTYRRTVPVDRTTDLDLPIALSMGYGSAAYEIRVDGQVIGADGDLGLDDGSPMNPVCKGLAWDIPASALADGQLEIEVLTAQTRGSHDSRLRRGVHALGPRDTVRALVDADNLRYTLLHRIPNVAATALISAAGLWHFLLWFRRKEQHASLAFAGLAAGTSVFLGVPVSLRTLHPLFGESVNTHLLFGGILLAGFGSVEFNAWFYEDRPPGRPGRAVQGALVALGAANVLLLLARSGVPDVLMQTTVVGSIGTLALGAVRAALRGNPDGRALVLGTLTATGLTLLSALAFYNTALDAYLELAIVGTITLLIGSIALAVNARYVRQLQALDASRAAAMRFVPVDFLDVLGVDDLTQVKRGDARALELTVMFTDIRGFTTRSEQFTAEENFAFVNRYLERMEPCIHEHGGFINQYLGDGVMALFKSADGAVAAGLAMQAEVARFSHDIGEPIRIGIGMNTGRVMLGTIGGRDRMDATIVSATQNLAARVEGMTKRYGVGVICTEHTRRALTEPVTLRELDWVVAKGSDEKLAIFEVRDEPGPTAFDAALTAYREGRLGEARAGFESCLDDPASARFLARIDRLEREGLPPDFDGVARLTEK